MKAIDKDGLRFILLHFQPLVKGKGPMTVKVKEYTKKDGTKVDSHKRHTPKK